ncbi:MAG: hypothetical protein A3I88_03050 [Candidatus Portnoybacteria bacterium RIFCSPLOWO2_12_FULL_39_9]|uniref:Carbohydrate kinase PfkB domain-containing protein n=1 Tax=Candidatus Portnoybacteria bacterium RIFCSPHIGHO2_12_FULL_38_9 TaxID=1801997 RepID=A0A1G2FFF8_9BACT|nr:MAG: hypothetical protein A3H00_00235 [Candidatus Portnoybacteria bacterium RBG_13_40_8]OGZ36217.1 MAG: hypothetical protein A2646_02310 [Candidatus Portnoybacteria bacterium RIFCSPHIGHO2_02_FULL_39_12]OGZ36789.1 MAG: hypothetical protein A3J64_02475 [Candidatus Portnoybacteria bacterium RIFCSPHIGHO2_12_FULL_38_9]OGZ38053.1 MAG: hypothetical protein A3F21_00400 [Candidatus Portnoybacteria bacterium RIFCSPLOWO2_01_FULL_38_39]OGZ41082.1 MAG: hypothetical protein A3I88_03050 [Candidatus Portnoy
MYDIITFGSATQDVFLSSRKFQVAEDERFITKKGLCVPLGSKIDIENVFFSVGGCGVNSAVTFSRQGFKAAYLGQVGKDLSGQAIKEELLKQAVSLELLKETDKWPTAYSLILTLPEVERSILEYLGASHRLTKEDIPFDKIKADWFYISSLSGESHKIFEPLVNFAYENKIKMTVNPGKTQLKEGLAALRSLLNKIDILILNSEEAAQLTEIDFQKEKEIFQKLDEWVDGLVVMTKGPKGVVASDGKNLYSAGIPESDFIDRTGAGDAFGSAFVAGWIDKQDITHAIQLGTANATSCLQEMGATKGLLKKSEWGPWPKVEVRVSKI